MAAIIPYPHRLAGHCGSGSYRDLLEFHGLSWGTRPLSEGSAFGLGAGLGFAFVELPQMSTPIYLVGRTAGLERDICTNLAIGLDLRQTDDAAQGWSWLRDELDAGRPTMVWADIGELDYLRVKLRMTFHDIVICGYDEDEGVALVADNDRAEIQQCSLESLARARNSTAFPGPNRHGTFVMDFPEALPDPDTAIAAALRGAIVNMRDGGDSLTAGSPPMGLAGVACFAESYAHWPTRFGEALPGALRGLRTFIVKAGTGGALFRSLHAEFLRDSATLLENPELTRAAEIYDQLAELWVALAATSSDADPVEAHAGGLDTVARIAALESDGVSAMESATFAA